MFKGISEKEPGYTMEKIDSLSALADVALEGGMHITVLYNLIRYTLWPKGIFFRLILGI